MSAQKRNAVGVVGGLLGFLGMSMIAGLLVAAAVTPALAVTGMAANNTIGIFDNLPDYLAIGDLAKKSNIYAKNAAGKDIFLASFYAQNREEVEWEDISQFVKDAAVAGEDQRFYSHGGVDIVGTIRAVGATLMKDDLQGGSTITQQYVKNVNVQKAEAIQDPEERQKAYQLAIETTPDRKLKEMKLAIGLEKRYSKDQILLGYLNIAGFGGTVYGIEAAAKYYFDVHAKDLTAAQAASLIAIVNNPVHLQLDHPESETNGESNGYAANKERRDFILGKMVELKKITQAQYDEAMATPIEPKITPSSTGCQSAGGSAYFCDYVTNVIQNDPVFGATEDARWSNFKRGGYKIYTTLNLPIQLAAEKAIKENVPPVVDWGDMGTASVAIEPGTGKVLAMAQNKKYSQTPEQLEDPAYSPLNLSTDHDAGGSNGFQPGSTYKVFTLAEWIKQGHPLEENFDGRDRPISYFRNSCGGDFDKPNDPYQPGNDDGRGANDAIQATKYSVNSAYMAMAAKMDLCQIKKTAQAFGIHRADGNPLGWTASSPDVGPEGRMFPSDVLGTQEVSPLTMAVAYAGIANKGVVCTPIVIEKIFDANGEEMTPPKSTCTEAVSPKVAAAMAYAMQQTFDATAYESDPRTDIEHIGKTGTNNDAVDTWMIGASTKVALATWVGSITGDANQRDHDFPSGYAASARHRMWNPIMTVADNEFGGDDFPNVDNKLLYGVPVRVPDIRGKTMEEAKSLLGSLGFNVDEGGTIDSELPKGQVAKTDPAGGAMITKGSLIKVMLSKGNLILVPDVTNYSENDARAALGQFSVEVRDQSVADPTQDGLVVGMDPAAGSALKPGQKVTIVVGRFQGAPEPPESDLPPGQGQPPGQRER